MTSFYRRYGSWTSASSNQVHVTWSRFRNNSPWYKNILTYYQRVAHILQHWIWIWIRVPLYVRGIALTGLVISARFVTFDESRGTDNPSPALSARSWLHCKMQCLSPQLSTSHREKPAYRYRWSSWPYCIFIMFLTDKLTIRLLRWIACVLLAKIQAKPNNQSYECRMLNNKMLSLVKLVVWTEWYDIQVRFGA